MGNQMDCSDVEQESEAAVMGELSGNSPLRQMGSRPVSRQALVEFPMQPTMPAHRTQSQPAVSSDQRLWGDLAFDDQTQAGYTMSWLRQDSGQYENDWDRHQPFSASGSGSRPPSRNNGP